MPEDQGKIEFVGGPLDGTVVGVANYSQPKAFSPHRPPMPCDPVYSTPIIPGWWWEYARDGDRYRLVGCKKHSLPSTLPT